VPEPLPVDHLLGQLRLSLASHQEPHHVH
jgi:hypothetical protein